MSRTDPDAFADYWPLKKSAEHLLARADTALAVATLRKKERAKLDHLGERHGDAVYFGTQATGLGEKENLERVRRAVKDGLAAFQIDELDVPAALRPGSSRRRVAVLKRAPVLPNCSSSMPRLWPHESPGTLKRIGKRACETPSGGSTGPIACCPAPAPGAD